ncbi:hypothetical protein [Streptomyces sp. NPDC058861]|uniref:hypothetical protein n=1 Tax=Streptomyces sp. NPDC058861 TaxID=3346653 RepID=UPI0036AE1AD4
MIHGAPTALLDPEADIEVVAETARGNAVVPAALAHRAVFAIRRVAVGEHVIDPRLAATALTAEKNPLTAREADVLQPAPAAGLVAGGPATAPGRRPPAVDH